MTDQAARVEAIEGGIAYIGPRLVAALDRHPDDVQLKEMLGAWQELCQHLLALTAGLAAPAAADFAVDDIVRVRGWGSNEYRVTGHVRKVVEGSDEPRDLVCLEGRNLWRGFELPELLTKVRSAGGAS